MAKASGIDSVKSKILTWTCRGATKAVAVEQRRHTGKGHLNMSGERHSLIKHKQLSATDPPRPRQGAANTVRERAIAWSRLTSATQVCTAGKQYSVFSYNSMFRTAPGRIGVNNRKQQGAVLAVSLPSLPSAVDIAARAR